MLVKKKMRKAVSGVLLILVTEELLSQKHGKYVEGANFILRRVLIFVY